MIIRNMVSTVKKSLTVSIALALVAWPGSLGAASSYVSGTVERIYYAHGNKFIQVGGRTFLVNKDTRFDIMQGKELIKNVPIRSLRHGVHLKLLVSDREGKPWAKHILIFERGGETQVTTGQISVPVVSPK
nr:hypothetical protein [Desulfobacterales bacterium]